MKVDLMEEAILSNDPWDIRSLVLPYYATKDTMHDGSHVLDPEKNTLTVLPRRGSFLKACAWFAPHFDKEAPMLYRSVILFLVLILLALPASANPIARAQAKAEAERVEDGTKWAQKFKAAKIIYNKPYGSGPKQKIDIFLPKRPQGAPILVMVHGGAWRTGDKTNLNVVENKATYWLSKGFIFVSVNYGLLNETPVSKQAEDVASALSYVQREALGWGGNPQKIVLMGHSAGAHLVTLLSANPALAKGVKPWLGTVALDSAVMDIVAIMDVRRPPRLYKDAFGTDKDYWKAMSPLHQVAQGAVPMMLVCSTQRDNACPQAQAFAKAALGKSPKVEVLMQDMSHDEINKNLGLPSAYTDKVDSFIQGILPR